MKRLIIKTALHGVQAAYEKKAICSRVRRHAQRMLMEKSR
jgi:hypothetical protein